MDKKTSTRLVFKQNYNINMKEFITSMILFVFLIIGIVYFKPHTWFYHSHECDGGIGGGCDTTTGEGNILTKWGQK